IDAQLLLLWSNAAQLGLYSIGVALAEALWHFPRAMNQAAVAKIAGGGRADALSLSLRTVRIGVFLTVIFGTLLALIARPLVLWVYGDAFEGSVACLLFLLPGMVGNAMAGPLGLFLSQQLGLPRHNAINSAIVLVVNIALNAVWIPRWGAVGAAAASSVTYLLMGLLAALRVRREPEFGWRRLLVVQKDDLRLMKSSLQALVSRGKR
ncbi:MAG: polysaccharide biosynthesis C-terminal domain-containing protein, partial [Candidatus Eisenbacteria bacterium]|nr:polysaccharide biosynthesis C-terminal domain-containing protein [Candidatus Eisenbacteria bacterium]